ncbi:hypothetical protein SASPL_149961 [Salvia splendens]|uniref:Disease resistance protein At4g27190-like leucine-rich repeats domain-containing protein n=2 Tax=Salvia splendens TaxID=180675 RepID=A0A8X8W5W3_SALSN|nr:hypothetical protein SASPL_149961 [Salvia splendens]
MKGLIEQGEIGASAALAQPVFSSLTRLSISNCNKMRIPLPGAPNLEDIHISECEEIEEIFEDEERHCLALPKLERVRLHDLPRLRKVGISLSRVPNLEAICVTKCGGLEDVFDDEGTGSLTLPNLIRLRLEELPKLKSLCKGTTIICNSIDSIYIRECPRLMNKLPVVVDSAMPRRCKIEVNTELWESLMSDNPNLSLFSKGGEYFILYF